MPEMKETKVLLAMSGGVDSSAAGKLLRDAGYDCVGCTMKLYENEDAGLSRSRTCCSLEDVEDARSAAFRLGIPYYVFNFTDAFREKVIGKFTASYCQGLTPNPCIDCNRYLKFGALLPAERSSWAAAMWPPATMPASTAGTGRYHLRKARGREQGPELRPLHRSPRTSWPGPSSPWAELRKEAVRDLAEEAGPRQRPASRIARTSASSRTGTMPGVIEHQTGKAAEPRGFRQPGGDCPGAASGASSATPWASTGDWASPCRSGAMSAASARRATPWSWGRRRPSTAGRPWRGTSTGSPGSLRRGRIRYRVKLRYRQREQDAEAIPLDGGAVRLRFDEPPAGP